MRSDPAFPAADRRVGAPVTAVTDVVAAPADGSPARRVAEFLLSEELDTPCYVYDAARAIQRYTALQAALGTGVLISVKANPNLELGYRLEHVRSGLEVASWKELNNWANSPNVFLNSPAVDRKLLRAGIGANVTFVIDEPRLLQELSVAAGGRTIRPVLLRLNAVTLAGVGMRTGTAADHFGMDWEGAREAVKLIRGSAGKIQLGGFHLFGGSYSFTRLGSAIAAAAPEMIARLETLYGAPLRAANLGGGFSEHWEDDARAFAEYRKLLRAIPPHVTLYHESGRGIFAACGVFVTSVVRTKRVGARSVAACDGGIAQAFLLAQTENPFRRLRSPYIVRKTPPVGDPIVTDLVGSSCNRADVIGRVDGPALQPGDLCVFADCGAYYNTYTVAPFLGLKEPSHYVIG
jgi:diaminopimelate decarboxylase